MAQVDKITQMIRNAQADAIRKNGTANGQAIQNDTVKFLKESIEQQKATAKSVAAPAAEPATTVPTVKDTRTTQQKHDDAKKAYDDYVSSDEYKQNQVANLKAQTDEWMNATIAGSEGYTPTPRKDQKEQELKALIDHYAAQVQQEENQRIRDADMKEIESWSDEDREQLRQYIENRDKNNEVTGRDNLILSLVRGIKLDKSKNALTEKYGAEKVDQLASTYSRYLKEKQAKQVEADTRAAVQKNPWVQQIPGAVNRMLGGPQAAADRFAEMFSRDDRYSTLAPYVAGDLISLQGNTVTGETANIISGDQYNENGEMIHDGGVLRQGAAYLYQGGMTMVDSFARAAAGGGPGGAAALAACNAFSQTVSDASRQGATPERAYTLGAAVAGVEYLSEKIPMERVFKLAKAGDTKVLVQAFKQAGIEISTEELSLLGSMAAEAAILQEKSSYKQQIGDLVAGGASYEEAKTQADKAVWEEVKQTALVSGFAGSLSGGGAALVGNLTTNATPEVTEEVQQEQAVQTPPAAPVVEPAQQAGPTVEQLLDGVQDMTPAPEPLSEELQHFDNAAAIANGVQPAQQPAVDTAPATEYDNNTITVPGAAVGKTGVTYTADNKPVQFQYAVVPAESLITSNDQFGNVNSAYPAELQPRDRTRTASQTQINSISRNLNPALLAESPTAQNGAPIIRGDGVVIGGNGRVSAIAQAYGAGRGAEYQQFITEKAAELGIDPATLPANPVLVRVTNGVDNYTELANSLNASTTASYSATEAANADAGKVGDIIEYLSVSEDGGINNADNRDFIQKFVAQVVPETERGDVMQANGQLSQAGERRIQNALFAYAYGDTALVERLAESTDNNAKNITNAMVATAGKIAQLQTEIARGEVQDLGLQNAITDAVNLYLDAKAGKQTVTDAAGQLTMGDNGPEAQYDGLTVHLAKFLESNNRSGLQIRKFIDILVDVNMNASAETATEVSMFDTGEQQTQEGLYDEAITAYDQQRDGKGRIPEKSDFSQYRQYEPGKLAGSMDGGSTEGNPGTAVPDGGIPQTVQGDVPGGRRPVKGTGAAERDFSGKPAYNATLAEDNAQADRRDDVRPMELPERDINGGNVSAVTGNVYGAGVTPDEFASLMEEPTAKGDFTYAKITNDQATQRATETIASAGTWENAYDSWKQSVTVGNAGAEMSARGALFLNYAAQQGNKQLWLETLHYMQKLGTNTAQGLQAFRIIRTLKPVDKIEFVKMSVEKMETEVREKHGIDLEIDQTLIDEFEQAETDADRDAVLEDIQQNVADQIPSTFLDKWTALRYMNMLGNLKTNVRNIAGNIGSAAVYRVKDTIATGMESIAHAVSGGKTERTKSLFVRKSLLDACKEDFNQFKETVSSGGKYGERMSASSQFEQGVQDKRRIFKNPGLEAYRKGTNWMMNNGIFGDEAFGRAAYSRALAGYLQANGVTGSDLSEVDGTLLDRARAYAIKEAQEATFHDNSTLAQIVSKVQKDTGIVGQGLMPFTKTPANVLTRAEEFSPLGLINSTVKSIQKARGNEDISGADVVNSWAKTITGVGLFALGAAMMDQGLLTGGPDEDEEKAEFDELVGKQNYSIQLPGGINYTIDWLTPAAMPMFMGAQFWKLFSDDRDLTFADMEQVFTSIADPMIQMSMLQGLNDSLDGIKYSDNNLGQFFINSAVSYLTQGLTNTLLGQIERSTEENRQTTYVDKNSNVPEWLQRQLGKASQKIPGWDYQQGEYLNAWGQTEKNEGGLTYNLLSPGYISTERSDPITKELNRLREATGENVFPQTVDKSVNFTDTDGATHTGYNLSQKELETMQKVEGQTSYRLMFEVISNSDYAGLTDKQKAEVISDIYSYAREQGLREALPNRFSDAEAWIDDIQGDPENGLIRRATLRVIHEAIENTVNSIENDWSVSPAAKQNLDALYDSFDGLSKEAQKQILDDAVSDTAKYLEIRSHGINTEQYLDVVTDIKDQPLQKGYSQIRDAQTYHAIAENDSLSNVQKDYVMKAYMPDYDPNAKTVDRTELKYDYMIEEGYSRAEFATAYDIYSHEKAVGGEGTADRTRERMCKELDIKMTEAKMLYKLFGGYYKPWE